MIFNFKNNEVNDFGIKASMNAKECVVLANGPSLKKAFNDKKTYDFIKNKTTFCVNSFCISKEFVDLQPKYICYADPVYWEKPLSSKLHDLVTDTKKALLSVTWPIVIFMPNYAKKWNHFIELPNKNINIKIIYINTSESKSKVAKRRFRDYKTNKATPAMQTVAILPIYLATNSQFSTIHLFGLDHSWHKDIIVREDNVVCIFDHHFYDKKEPKLVPCYADGSQKTTSTLANEFLAYHRVALAHMDLNKYANAMNVKIYNYGGRDSYVDAYERKAI